MFFKKYRKRRKAEKQIWKAIDAHFDVYANVQVVQGEMAIGLTVLPDHAYNEMPQEYIFLIRRVTGMYNDYLFRDTLNVQNILESPRYKDGFASMDRTTVTSLKDDVRALIKSRATYTGDIAKKELYYCILEEMIEVM